MSDLEPLRQACARGIIPAELQPQHVDRHSAFLWCKGALRGYSSRNGEVAGLTKERDSYRDRFMDYATEVDNLQHERREADELIPALRAEVAELRKALGAIITHQEIVGGGLASISTVSTIARKALGKEMNEKD